MWEEEAKGFLEFGYLLVCQLVRHSSLLSSPFALLFILFCFSCIWFVAALHVPSPSLPPILSPSRNPNPSFLSLFPFPQSNFIFRSYRSAKLVSSSSFDSHRFIVSVLNQITKSISSWSYSPDSSFPGLRRFRSNHYSQCLFPLDAIFGC